MGIKVVRAVLAGLVLGVATAVAGEPATAQESCRFVLGFEALRNAIGAQKVGTCLEDEHFNLENGNAEQRTSGGLMVWRKVDNFTAFTDGGTSWVNGPNGLQSRPNGERFSWERDPVQASAPPPAAPRVASAPQATATPQPRATATATPRQAAPTATPRPRSDDPVKLSGERAQNTKPFDLEDGNYTVSWEIKLARGSTSCFGGGTIYRVEGKRHVESLFSAILGDDKGKSADGETELYGIKAGQHYLDISGSCLWSVEIRPA